MTRIPCLVAGLCLFAVLTSLAEAQDKKEITVVTGKVKVYESADPALVTIITSTGEIQAELAPVTYLKEQKLVFNANEEITVRGFEEMRGGTRRLVVTEVTTKERPAIRLRKDEDLTPVWTKTTTETITPGGTQTEIRMVKGKVKTFERRDPAMVTVITDTGELQAELAPVTFLEEQKIVINPDDEISFRGFEEMIGGRRTFIVTEVTTKERTSIRLRQDDKAPVWKVKIKGGGN